MPQDPRTTRRLLASALALGVLAVVTSACGLFDDPNAPDPTLPPPPETDVAYGPAAGCPGTDDACGGSQLVDIYRSGQPGPNPVLLFFHGGGFVGGDKVGSISAYLTEAMDDGWDIVAVNYRLTTPDGTNAFPAAVSDAKRVVRWVKANAEAQDWDAENVAAMGHSAGGNLAGMLAVTADQPEFDATDLPPDLAATDASVVAVIALNPVSDLTLFGANPRLDRVDAALHGLHRRLHHRVPAGLGADPRRPGRRADARDARRTRTCSPRPSRGCSSRTGTTARGSATASTW